MTRFLRTSGLHPDNEKPVGGIRDFQNLYKWTLMLWKQTVVPFTARVQTGSDPTNPTLDIDLGLVASDDHSALIRHGSTS